MIINETCEDRILKQAIALRDAIFELRKYEPLTTKEVANYQRTLDKYVKTYASEKVKAVLSQALPSLGSMMNCA